MPPPTLFKLPEKRTLKYAIINDDELRQLVTQEVLLPWNSFDYNGYPTLQTKPK